MDQRRVDAPSTVAHVRMTTRERAEMEDAAARLGCRSVSEYLRHLHRQAKRLVAQYCMNT